MVTDNTVALRLGQLELAGLVPVIRAPNAEIALAASRALVRGGMLALEITLTVPDALAVIRTLRDEYGAGVLIGAGTVTDVTQLKASVEAGAQFVVTPVGLVDLVAPAHDAGVVVALGALTPTEVWRAWSAGADVVKVFPASAVGGAAYIQALRGPFPEIRLMPTGGVSLSTLQSFVAAGAFALGVGGGLVDIGQLQARGPEFISEQARMYLDQFVEARGRT
jgi:2-dehydro-3-deoxyphosphogluconate aldolase/(4S)-4-hydroxy-2-oxoglutarate aldolase